MSISAIIKIKLSEHIPDGTKQNVCKKNGLVAVINVGVKKVSCLHEIFWMNAIRKALKLTKP